MQKKNLAKHRCAKSVLPDQASKTRHAVCVEMPANSARRYKKKKNEITHKRQKPSIIFYDIKNAIKKGRSSFSFVKFFFVVCLLLFFLSISG